MSADGLYVRGLARIAIATKDWSSGSGVRTNGAARTDASRDVVSMQRLQRPRSGADAMDMHTARPLPRILAMNVHRAILAWIVAFELVWGLSWVVRWAMRNV